MSPSAATIVCGGVGVNAALDGPPAHAPVASTSMKMVSLPSQVD
jgi:hypothetical protein